MFGVDHIKKTKTKETSYANVSLKKDVKPSWCNILKYSFRIKINLKFSFIDK